MAIDKEELDRQEKIARMKYEATWDEFFKGQISMIERLKDKVGDDGGE